ncbi:baseplate assembly protein [Pseudoalteromonas byunsanensis]|uniref:Baseplate protein n=1 Tax=Pseudoalteromonas byunsanensis TaxID=327939 RepID=A0A1S1N9Z5_9GAMM|nr:baseplate J/gp47 family protein [Pseudoalteromonas byunsanensis]OHU96839.1 baseplate protein [Pseudoalteromonas byunsanensis]
MNNAIELSRLAVPDVIESLEFETIYQQMQSALLEAMPTYSQLESDPATKLLEIAATRELLLRQRINDAARSVMVAYAKGKDLDHLGVLFGVQRSENESDERYRARIPLSLESHSMAGTMGAYEYQTMAATQDVKDVYVYSSQPGVVDVKVLPQQGTDPIEVISQVRTHLNDEDIRPLTDLVRVHQVVPKKYQVKAQVYLNEIADRAKVDEQINSKLKTFIAEHYKLGQEVPQSGIIDMLHQAGVRKVKLITPVDDISCLIDQAAIADSISIEYL